MQELQNENDKLKREVNKLMKSISENVNFEKGGSNSPAGKEFMGKSLYREFSKSLYIENLVVCREFIVYV